MSSYNPDDFRRSCISLGYARAKTVDRYITMHAKGVYHDDDFIAVYRMEVSMLDGIAHSNPLSPARIARMEEKAKRLG